jgi:hypothetical protein
MNGNDQQKSSRPTRALRVRNERDNTLTLVLEPWAGEYSIAPQEELDVVEEGGVSSEILEIRVEASRIVFFGRSESTLRVLRDGVELP